MQGSSSHEVAVYCQHGTRAVLGDRIKYEQTVGDIKRAVEKKLGIPADKQQLFWHNKELTKVTAWPAPLRCRFACRDASHHEMLNLSPERRPETERRCWSWASTQAQHCLDMTWCVLPAPHMSTESAIV